MRDRQLPLPALEGPASGAHHHRHCPLLAPESDSSRSLGRWQVPLSSICYHGSRLVQALARFKERSLLLSSLRTLSPADLLTLARDPVGSHVLQALVTTGSDKGRGKILKRLEVRVTSDEASVSLCDFFTRNLVPFLSQGQYVNMASSRLGSRVLEAIWNSASISHRQSIAQELGNVHKRQNPPIS